MEILLEFWGVSGMVREYSAVPHNLLHNLPHNLLQDLHRNPLDNPLHSPLQDLSQPNVTGRDEVREGASAHRRHPLALISELLKTLQSNGMSLGYQSVTMPTQGKSTQIRLLELDLPRLPVELTKDAPSMQMIRIFRHMLTVKSASGLMK